MKTKRHISWSEAASMASLLARQILSTTTGGMQRVYGVPRGGVHVAQLLVAANPAMFNYANSLHEATIVVDDIIDSGKTREDVSKKTTAEFFALVDYSSVTINREELPWVVFPWEADDEPEGGEDSVRRLLQVIGENPDREGLIETPKRFVKALKEMTSGYDSDPAEHLRKNFSLEDGVQYDEMIISRNIPFVSLCEHHMLPFYGEATVGYLPAPDGRVVGLSKLARLVDGYAKRLQVQERLTAQIAKAMLDVIQPLAAGVTIKAKHTCQCFRGVQKGGDMVTSALHGQLREDPALRAEWFALLKL